MLTAAFRVFRLHCGAKRLGWQMKLYVGSQRFETFAKTFEGPCTASLSHSRLLQPTDGLVLLPAQAVPTCMLQRLPQSTSYPTTMLVAAGGCSSSWNTGTELPSMYLDATTAARQQQQQCTRHSPLFHIQGSDKHTMLPHRLLPPTPRPARTCTHQPTTHPHRQAPSTHLSVAPLASSVTVLMTPPDDASRAIASPNASTTNDSASSRVMSALQVGTARRGKPRGTVGMAGMLQREAYTAAACCCVQHTCSLK